VSAYAAVRNALYNAGKTIEITVNYEPKLHYFTEWWKQLYGESEGKDNKGIFPAGVGFTTDLHSMGQYIQDGRRNIFETVISVKRPTQNVKVPSDNNNLDGLNYIAGRALHEVNHMAETATTLAHVDGGVPNIQIEIPDISENTLGQLIYFYEMACAVSGYILGVNPFDQPGVEAYKKNMFALLGKPGFEKETAAIKKRLNG
jgi:glucose-6-phosphate isomerase